MSTVPTDQPNDKAKKTAELITNIIDNKLSPIFEDVKQQREQLDRITHELGNTNQNLHQVKTMFEQIINSMQTQAPAQEQVQASQGMAGVPNMNQLPPELKVQAVSMIGQTISELIRAWRGSSPSSPDPMSEMGKQLMADLFRATVDDIQQRVYGIRKIPPPGISQSHSLE